MSDTSSNSSLPVNSSSAVASAIPSKSTKPLESEPQKTTLEEDEPPPILPRNVTNHTGPNRPLPASPTRQQPSQRLVSRHKYMIVLCFNGGFY
jgi:hypothetical protein